MKKYNLGPHLIVFAPIVLLILFILLEDFLFNFGIGRWIPAGLDVLQARWYYQFNYPSLVSIQHDSTIALILAGLAFSIYRLFKIKGRRWVTASLFVVSLPFQALLYIFGQMGLWGK